MADVWDNGPDDPTLTNVLVVLGNSADDNGENCFPGNALIARRTRYSERTVIRAIVELERQGWITVLQRGGGRPKRGARKHELAEYHTQYRINVSRLKGCQSVTVLELAERVTPATRKGDRVPGKGDTDDNPPHPLFGRTVREPSLNRSPQPPTASRPQGVMKFPSDDPAERVSSATDQVCSALGIGEEQRRKRRMVRGAIRLAAEKGELPATIALDMIAAVRDQDEEYLRGRLKFKYGLAKFIGEGIWRDRDRWGWDVPAMRLQAEARAGSFG